MQDKQILIVDDDPELVALLKMAFLQEGARVAHAGSSRAALRLFYELRPHLVLLDLVLPDLDGWETYRRLRALADTPVIMLTSLPGEDRVVQALDSGVDDYVAKPVSVPILLARARAVLRRSEGATVPSPPVDDGYLLVDLTANEVRLAGDKLHLTATEYRLLAYLVRYCGLVRTYPQILENVWGWEYRDSQEYVHVYISRLRQKLEPEPAQPRYLQTEYGIGYRFICPAKEVGRI